jgi:CBS domain-containing protein
MKVKEIMTAQPRTASRDTTLAAAAQLLWAADCGILPVVDSGKLVGVVTDRDMYVALATRNAPASQLTIGEVATSKVWACGPDDDVHAALDTMAAQRVRRLPVTQDGAVVGVISVNDLVLAAGADRAVRNEEVVATLKAICAHPAAPAAAAA